MKKALTILVILIIAAAGYVLYQYQKVAAEAEAQVEKDIAWLEQGFRNQSSDALQLEHKGDKYVQTQLVMQSVNEAQKFVRHYHSLFIKNGQRSCLLSQVTYFQMQPEMFKQIWLESAENCLP